MNKKGQALVEFVIVLPIMIFILLAAIDVGKIFYFSNKLENKINDVIEMYENNESESKIKKIIDNDIKDVKLVKTDSEKYTTVELTKKVSRITPGLNLILKNPYELKAKRMIYNEIE